MSKENTDFLKKIVSAMAAASKDVTRYHLNGVLLDPSEGVIKIVATDGHRLILDRAMVENKPTKKLLVREHNIPAIKAAIKQYKYGCDIKFNLETMEIGRDFKVVLEEIETYPKYEQLLPKFTPTYEIAFNAKLLNDLAKAMKTGKHEVVKLGIKDKLSPIMVSVPGNETCDAVLMPCRA